MEQIIKTRRLELKPFSPEDRSALSELLLNGDIKKTYMIPDFATPQALDKMIKLFMDYALSPAHFTRGIYLQGSLIGFVNDVEITAATMELGYVIHPAHWGRGYATEMLGAAIASLFRSGFCTVRTGAFAENAASLRVMEKCGLKKCPNEETISYRGSDHRCVYYEIRKEGESL